MIIIGEEGILSCRVLKYRAVEIMLADFNKEIHSKPFKRYIFAYPNCIKLQNVTLCVRFTFVEK